ncbi:MBL fold metallo-hydrolase [Promethearchaeum syntrophicum]|uniref:MBL fold metallo-hydrolase n=1 Tax=Promethearchaeum syntrophicum TaxID=2594042 RepID=A0A5B9DEX2_9ARCH
MEIIFLGTSGYGITATRNLPSILIDKCILVDCGEGCLNSLYKYNCEVQALKAIFISHVHPDHILGLITLLSKIGNYNKDSSIKKYPPIYVPKGMKIHLERIIEATYSNFLNRNFRIKIIELELNQDNYLEITINNKLYHIKWVKTMHSPICYAFNFNDEVIISGDTAPFLDFNEFIKNIPILVHEATFSDEDFELAHKLNHSTPSDVAKIANDNGIKQVYLYHVPDIDENEEKGFVSTAKTIFPNLFVAHDGDRIIFPPNVDGQ